MSRRKQSRPRHVDDPDLDSPAISANPVGDTAVFQEDSLADGVAEEAVDKTDTVDEHTEDIQGVVNENQMTKSPSNDTNTDGQLVDAAELEFNKNKFCKPVQQLFKENLNQSEEVGGVLCNGNDLGTSLPEESHLDKVKAMSHDILSENGRRTSIDNDENETGDMNENFDDQSDFDDEFSKSENYDIDDDENDLDSLKGDKLESSKNGDIPNFALPNGGPNSNSNVLLEPLQATKAAVAQFAENNQPEKEKDNTQLHSTLFNLQQQQIMQLQLIHQLQQQLVAGGMQNSPLSAALLNGQLPLGANFPGLNLNLPGMPGYPDKNKMLSKSNSSSESPSPKPADLSQDDDKDKDLSSEPPSPVAPISNAVTSSSAPLLEAPMSPTEPSSTSSLAHLASSASKAGSNTSPSLSGLNPVIDYSRSSSKNGSEGQSGYLGGDDPFFKHKCRLCQKVFGSDSALQIHVRSHTDPRHHAFYVDGRSPLGLGAMMSSPDIWACEKPFLCNICGGRFSTRGNLKVHFTRHKMEFPNAEMNPNPVPEHLDKSPMAMMGSPFPAAALTPFANPAFMGMQGLMNGFMFPPPHLAPRPPMSMSSSMIPKPIHESRHRRSSSPIHESRHRHSSSPTREPSSRHSGMKKEFSPTRSGSEAPQRPSPDTKDSAKLPHTPSPSSTTHLSKPSPVMPPMSSIMSSIPLVSNYPVMSPLPSQPPYTSSSRISSSYQPQMPIPTSSGNPYRPTILPSNLLDNDDSMEQFMECSKSETSKLQQLVDNIEHKLTDPNQCVICHRVLSCKSALQMHYRIHTGERPFKCKICGRSFTTKGNLKTHMGVHRAKPPLRMMHQCPVCHKQFTNLLVLQQHIRSHTGMSSLPMMPGMNFNIYGNPPHMDPHHQPHPLNMKRQFNEGYDKELDLSKKPRLDRDIMDKLNNHDINDGLDDPYPDDVSDDVSDDDDDIEQNEMDDEANKLAAKDAMKDGLKREDSEGRSTPEDSGDELDRTSRNRPISRQSNEGLGFTNTIPRSSSPKYLQEDSNMSQEGKFNAYSTSLAALEERVRAIDSTMARNPLSQFHAAPFLLAPNHYANGERVMSPRSESGSENGEKKALTPALSVSSNGSMDNNFMIGAMDVRAQMDNQNSTTCNICYKTFACRSALDIHYRSHTRERPYKCNLCDRSFTTRGNMRQHLLTHKMDGEDGGEMENNNNSCTPNKNDNDSENSNDSSQFNDSYKETDRRDSNESQESVKKEVSPSETKSTSHSNSLNSSLSTSSVTPSRSSSSLYTSPPDSQSPYISKSSTVKHQCLVCQKGFSSASALQIHIRTHTGDKPFKCSVCGKAFTTKGNLKVHMGTHMWNNSPSRRGRRMSIEPPFMLAHKENPYLPHGFPPRPDFYPFQFPPFMNGLPTPPKTFGELSIMQGLHGSGVMKPELLSPHADHGRSKSNRSPVQEDKPKFAESGELDLSMKSIGSTGSRSSEKTSPSSVDSNSSSGMVSPPHMSLGWGWKASCHLCSRSFPTPAALEHHIRSMHMVGDSLPKVAAS